MLDLKRLLSGETREISYNTCYNLSELSPDITEGECKVNITVSGSSDYAMFKAHFESNFTAVCARCSEEFSSGRSFDISLPLAYELASEDDEDKFILIEDSKINVDDICESAIILDLPSRFLCREECKGLCPGCGINLNKGVCSCTSKKIDPRLAKLKDYFKN